MGPPAQGAALPSGNQDTTAASTTPATSGHPQPQGTIVPGPNLDDLVDLTDSDSAYAESVSGTSSWTASITSSVLTFRTENGRTYHSFKEGKYALPNDESENDRLDLQHELFTLTFDGKLLTGPVGEVGEIHNVLDVGTGTGLWAIDFAEQYPEAEVIGIDLSPIQPSWVPPNVKFVVDDIEEPWHYNHKFNIIHSRMMVGSILDWPGFFTTCYEWLEPGGLFEVQDVAELKCDDDTFSLDPPSCALAEWWLRVCEALTMIGRPMNCAPMHKERILAAGFSEVQETTYHWPINMWPSTKRMKKIGLWSHENTIQALEALAMAPLTRFLKWKPEEVQVLVAKARDDLKNEKIHAYWTIRVIHGRKPRTA